MSTKIKRISIWIGALVFIFITAWLMLFPSRNESILAFQVRYGFIRVGPQNSSYVGSDFDSQVDESEIIFVGKVTSISPTKWNQDSGEFWLGGRMYHTIQFEVSQYVVDRIGLNNQKAIEVFVLEPSPLDGDNRDNGLSLGSVTVVFARNANIIWRGGIKKQFIYIVSGPTASMFVQDDNGNLHGQVFHNLGKGKFAAFATRKGQEKYRLGMEERKTNPKHDPSGGGGFMPEWVSISLPDFIAQIQAADQNQPFEFDSTVTPTVLPVDTPTGTESTATASPEEIIQETATPTP